MATRGGGRAAEGWARAVVLEGAVAVAAAGRLGLWIKCLPYKDEEVSSNAQHPGKRARHCGTRSDPSAGGTGTGGLWGKLAREVHV